LYIKEQEGGASGFSLGDNEVTVQDDVVASSEVASIGDCGNGWESDMDVVRQNEVGTEHMCFCRGI
jgi:hypothetical protein